MWQPYVDLAYAYFPDAVVIIDKYHFVRQATWAIEKTPSKIYATIPS